MHNDKALLKSFDSRKEDSMGVFVMQDKTPPAKAAVILYLTVINVFSIYFSKNGC